MKKLITTILFAISTCASLTAQTPNEPQLSLEEQKIKLKKLAQDLRLSVAFISFEAEKLQTATTKAKKAKETDDEFSAKKEVQKEAGKLFGLVKNYGGLYPHLQQEFDKILNSFEVFRPKSDDPDYLKKTTAENSREMELLAWYNKLCAGTQLPNNLVKIMREAKTATEQ